MALKKLPLLLEALVLVSLSRSELPPPEKSYNILMLLPFGANSHRNMFLPIAEALAKRNHKITILSALPPKNFHPNVLEITYENDDISDNSRLDMFKVRLEDPTGGFQMFEHKLRAIAEDFYQNPIVLQLFRDRKKFDFILIDELFNEFAYPFLHNSSFGLVGTAGILSTSSAVLGNVLNPAYVAPMQDYYIQPFDFIRRIKSLGWHIFVPLMWRHWKVLPKVQELLDQKFPDIPSIQEIERNASLILANFHFALDQSIPLLPSQVDVAGMHCRPAKPLPKDILDWIEGSGDHGVIYFSLGSVARGASIPSQWRDILIESLGKMKQRVIWKYEEKTENLPSNILVRSWLPQQDILADPRVHLFITHGGLLSLQEAVYHPTPLLALPIFGDQAKNAKRIQAKGIGKWLLWEDLTVDLVTITIEEILNDPRYMKEIQEISAVFKDNIQNPVEKAVWWTEYVIRHKGALRLRSPGANLSWVQFLMLDVILVIFLCVSVTIILFVKLLKKLYQLFFTRKPEQKKKKKKE